MNTSEAIKNAQETVAQVVEIQHSGSKYIRKVRGSIDGRIDIYAILLTFGVTCPARQHAIKKLLCAGLRGKGSASQDLRECRDAVQRAIEIQEEFDQEYYEQELEDEQ